MNVTEFGAVGDGRTDDSKAIQAANDAVAKRGGGQIFFPAGKYRAYGVRIDSCVGFLGVRGAELIHRDGESAAAIVQGRVNSTAGEIAQGSKVLRVAAPGLIRPGVLVAVRGAGGPSSIQVTELAADATPIDKALRVRDTKGLRQWTNFLIIGDEIVSYSGVRGNQLQNVRRGLFGTAAKLRPAGTEVSQALRLYAVVESVAGDRMTLDRSADFSVVGADVSIGSVGVSLQNLTLNGNRYERKPVEGNPLTADFELARWITIHGCTFKNSDHGGVRLDTGTSDSVIEANTFTHDTSPDANRGSSIWLFRGARRNVVRANTFSGSNPIGVVIDDRTDYSSEYDMNSNGNTVRDNDFDITPHPGNHWNAAVVVASSSWNNIFANEIRNGRSGVIVARTEQGTRPADAQRNQVSDNIFFHHAFGVKVSGSENSVTRNLLRDVEEPLIDRGERNVFADNVIEP